MLNFLRSSDGEDMLYAICWAAGGTVTETSGHAVGNKVFFRSASSMCWSAECPLEQFALR